MKIHIKITEPEDIYELMDLLKKLVKVRESIYTCLNEDFTVEISTKKTMV